MLKLTLAAIAVALITPALAHGATMRATVVAKQAKRHALVVATRHGDVMSARVSLRQLHNTRVGTRLTLVSRRLADGSLHVVRMRALGKAARAHIHVVVVKARARRLLVAGGGTAFALGLSRRTRVLASAAPMHPGDEIDATVDLSREQALSTTVQVSGEAPLIEFSGVVTAIDSTSITLASDGLATVVRLPGGVVLPPIVRLGSEVEVVASISGSTLTLAAIKLDDESSQDNGGSSVGDQDQVEAEGFVTGLDSGSITIQPGDNASPVNFAIPAGFAPPPGLALGSIVEARGEMANGVLTLTRLELKTEDGDQAELEAEGAVTALDSGSITIQTSDGDGGSGGHMTFAIPAGFTLPNGLSVGSAVDAKGTMVGGIATLSEIEIQNEDGS